jgi:hypothetical protein
MVPEAISVSNVYFSSNVELKEVPTLGDVEVTTGAIVSFMIPASVPVIYVRGRCSSRTESVNAPSASSLNPGTSPRNACSESHVIKVTNLSKEHSAVRGVVADSFVKIIFALPVTKLPEVGAVIWRTGFSADACTDGVKKNSTLKRMKKK